MTYDFEGKTEKEAIDKAAAELGLERDCFDVEILETQKGGLFRKGSVKIRVHINEPDPNEGRVPETGRDGARFSSRERPPRREERNLGGPPEPKDDFEKALVGFVTGIIERMGYDVKVVIQFREAGKLGLRIDSSASAALIGRKGKTLDALQLLTTLYATATGGHDTRVVLDSENYRLRREEALVRLAYNVAERVRSNRNSILLEPMNPFDRRIIHTTLSELADVETHSEGEGLYKQVRVLYKR